MTFRLLAVAAGLLTALVAPPSFASDPAVALFNDGLALLKRGDLPGACAQFRASRAAGETVGALARIAECDQREGHLVAALQGWERARTLAMEKRDDRVPVIDAAIARADAVLPKARIAVPPEAPAGFRLELDGAAVMPGKVIPLDPGNHKLAAAAPNKQRWELTFEARADGREIELSVPGLMDLPSPREAVVSNVAEAAIPARARVDTGSEPGSDSHPTSPAADNGHRIHPMRVAGIAAAAAGAAALVAGAVFALAAATSKGDAGCNGLACTTNAGAATLRGAKQEADAATVLFAVGAIGVAGGVTIALVSPARIQPPVVGAEATSRWRDRTLSFTFSGRF